MRYNTTGHNAIDLGQIVFFTHAAFIAPGISRQEPKIADNPREVFYISSPMIILEKGKKHRG